MMGWWNSNFSFFSSLPSCVVQQVANLLFARVFVCWEKKKKRKKKLGVLGRESLDPPHRLTSSPVGWHVGLWCGTIT